MVYCTSEILENLEIGKSYSSRQLQIFLFNNENTTILSKSCSQFLDWQDKLIKVLDIVEGYPHTADVRTNCYNIPNGIHKVYIVE